MTRRLALEFRLEALCATRWGWPAVLPVTALLVVILFNGALDWLTELARREGGNVSSEKGPRDA